MRDSRRPFPYIFTLYNVDGKPLTPETRLIVREWLVTSTRGFRLIAVFDNKFFKAMRVCVVREDDALMVKLRWSNDFDPVVSFTPNNSACLAMRPITQMIGAAYEDNRAMLEEYGQIIEWKTSKFR